MTTDPKNLVGVTLSGRYKIERAIGEGGMGAVFEATQLSLGRHVAVKVVKPARKSDEGADEEALRRFERETEVIARMNHPNIVQVVDAGRAEDGTMFLAMELLNGDNVKTLVRREGPFPVQRALAVIEDVASALVAAHAAGVIHRDLKAENVMLVRAHGKSEIAKVLDFGVAKLTTQTEAPPVTGSGFVAGTPGCIAPEQMLGKTDDPRSDLYSLGVLLFEMLAGQPPFVTSSSMELMVKHLTEVPPRVADVARARGREVPVPVDELVAALLAKDPDMRPPSAQALVEIVHGLRDAGNATQPDVRLPLFTPPPPPGAPLPGSIVGSKVVAIPGAVAPSPTSSPGIGSSPTSAPPSLAPSPSSSLRERPLARVDAGYAKALDVARKRAKIPTDTSMFLESLATADPERAKQIYEAHQNEFGCWGGLHAQMFAQRFTVATASPVEDEKYFREVKDQHRPVNAVGIARALRNQGCFDEAREVLRNDVMPVASGVPQVILALAEIDIAEGKLDAARETLGTTSQDVRVLSRRAWLDAESGKRDAYDRVIKRLETLDDTNEAKVDGFALLAHLLITQGRLQEADAMYERAVALVGNDARSAGRALEITSFAGLFAGLSGRVEQAARWQAEFETNDKRIPATHPAAERLRAMSLASDALIALRSNKDIEQIARNAEPLKDARQDARLIAPSVEFEIQLGKKNYAEAAKVAATLLPQCWSQAYQGKAWYRSSVDPALSDDERSAGRAKAKQLLDEATSEPMRSRCTTGFNILPFLQRIVYTHAIVDRAQGGRAVPARAAAPRGQAARLGGPRARAQEAGAVSA